MQTGTQLLETETPESVDAEPDQIAVAEALEAVVSDSRNDPRSFLDETVVPHGGE